MKHRDIPNPPPSGFESADPKAEATNTVPGPAYHPWGPKGGHLENAGDEVMDSIWNVPDGRRKGA